tara:strand:- start:591 stop:917 length:327 start_codon:yes stop_codon:yes gene_type:complete
LLRPFVFVFPKFKNLCVYTLAPAPVFGVDIDDSLLILRLLVPRLVLFFLALSALFITSSAVSVGGGGGIGGACITVAADGILGLDKHMSFSLLLKCFRFVLRFLLAGN